MSNYRFEPGCDHGGSHVGHIKNAMGTSIADVHVFAKQTALDLIRDANALPEAQREIVELKKERDRFKEEHAEACHTIAKMHEAAVGEVTGPNRGVIEDVADIRTNAYNDVADWLNEKAADMQKQSEETVFSPRPARAVLTADDVKKMAKQLRRRAAKQNSKKED